MTTATGAPSVEMVPQRYNGNGLSCLSHGWGLMARSSPGLAVTSALLVLALCLGVGPDGQARAAGPLLTISEVRTDQFPEVSVVLTVVDGSGVPIADLGPD